MSAVWPVPDAGWSLFLDRDGVINERLPGQYVTHPSQLVLLPGVTETLAVAARCFGQIFLVTNQQGIGKGLMTEQELHLVHDHLLSLVLAAGGRIDRIYHCPHLEGSSCGCRKPETGMFDMAQKDFPWIAPERSFMVGDMPADMRFGRKLGMFCVACGTEPETCELADACVADLPAFARTILNTEPA